MRARGIQPAICYRMAMVVPRRTRPFQEGVRSGEQDISVSDNIDTPGKRP